MNQNQHQRSQNALNCNAQAVNKGDDEMLNTNQSALDVHVVTPNNDANLPKGNCKAIYIGDATVKDVAIVTAGGQTVTLTNLLPGQVHQFAVKRVLATGTTATNILALY